MNQRPLILVTNDDGHGAKGLMTLIDVMSKFGDVVCVCPAEQQSAKSMAITMNMPMRIHREADHGSAKVYTVTGTPVDCVKLAMQVVFKDRKPDLVVAGINHGSNASVNVYYSGTMGAVCEGCECGIPSIGFSLTDHAADADFVPGIPFISKITDMVIKNGLPRGVCLNVNIPNNCVPSGMRVVRDCRGRWSEEYIEYKDPMGKPFYWITGTFINDEPEATDTDQWCLEHGIISIVPTVLDRTAPKHLVPKWLKNSSVFPF
jgi:5'-nucleotidase